MLNKKALAGAPSTPPVFVEDVFSTYLWDGNSTARNIVNGIDLAGKGGLVWTKYRNAEASHRLYDTNRGATKQIFSDLTNAEQVAAQSLTAFNSDGFSLGTGQPNETTATVVGWTFRKQAKFFDVVTYTGNGTASRTISHALGSAPGCMIIKRTDTAGSWMVYHRSTNLLILNSASSQFGVPATAERFGDDTNVIAPTSSVFTLGTNDSVNATGGTYVAYLFAHDAGGFGTAGTDNVISCGSYSSATSVNLGYEPQWLMVKHATGGSGNWYIINNMTGFTTTAFGTRLFADLANAEGNDSVASVTSTGFNSQLVDGAGTYIYIAIRRGPMKTPTSGTSVFETKLHTGTGANAPLTGGSFPPDLFLSANRDTIRNRSAHDRLRGIGLLVLNLTNNEDTGYTNSLTSFNMTGISVGTDSSAQTINNSAKTYAHYYFGRAPGFMDVVCYTGTGSATTQAHNLTVVPELMIVKARANARNWTVYSAATGNGGHLILNDASAYEANSSDWNSTTPTSSVFTVGGNYTVNDLNAGMVAYLFATLAGVSKVGSYTGTGTTQTINCGFTAGARFVLIKRTDSTGAWYVWDSARGIVAGNDPYLLLNSTAAEVTNTDYVDTASSGFEISSTAPAAINANGGSFIFMAIA